MEKEGFQRKTILGFILLAIIFFIYILTPFFDVIVWSAIVSFYLFPIYKGIYKKTKRKRASAILVLSIFVCFILVPLSLVSVKFTYQLSSFIENLKPFLDKDFSEILTHFVNINLIIERLPQIREYLPSIQEKLSALTSEILQYGFSVFSVFVKKTINLGFLIVLTLITVYYFLIDGEKILNTIKSLFLMVEGEKELIFERISLVLKGVLYGSILTGFIQGLLAFIIYFILGIPQYLIWAFLTMIASFIPIFGTSLIWGPLVIYLLIKSHYIKAIILLIYSITLISQIDNIIKPFLIGGKTKIHNLLIFFGVMGGLIKFGVLGVFLGPVIVGIFLCAIEIYKIHFIKNSV